MSKIYFWRTSDPYGCFSNFSRHPIAYGNITPSMTFPTSEHLYQALKFNGTLGKEIIEKICHASTPKIAKVLAYKHIRENPEFLIPDWDEIKLDVMRSILRLKYEQHEFVRNKLKESEDAEIIEASPWDSFWGYGKDQKGQNWLGKLWMELRQERKYQLDPLVLKEKICDPSEIEIENSVEDVINGWRPFNNGGID